MKIKDKFSNNLKTGDFVIWHDPDKKARDLTRIWRINEIKEEIITIYDIYSEAEVNKEELEKIIDYKQNQKK